MCQFPPNVRLISCINQYGMSDRSLDQIRTVAPRDHMSVDDPHLRINCVSGLLKIAALIV
jgi:hypothetical protein